MKTLCHRRCEGPRGHYDEHHRLGHPMGSPGRGFPMGGNPMRDMLMQGMPMGGNMRAGDMPMGGNMRDMPMGNGMPMGMMGFGAHRVVRAVQRMMEMPWMPQCDDEGGFRPLQCHGIKNECWCVDDRGQEIDGSRKSYKTDDDKPDCG